MQGFSLPLVAEVIELSQSDWASSSRQTVVHESAGDVVAMVGMMVAVCVDSVELRVFLCFM
jgi:hypothetical protein